MDKVKAVKSQLRLQQWAERISECQSSSMTVAAWCDAHDINVKTYYYWLRKVREMTVEIAGGTDQQTVEAVLLALKSVC